MSNINITATEANKLSYEGYNHMCTVNLDKIENAILEATKVGRFHAVVSIDADYIDFVIDHLLGLGYIAQVMSNNSKTIEINW